MNPRLAIISGGRAGAVEKLTGPMTSIGRHPTCAVRLDPDHDTEVSTRHAVIQRVDDGYTIRDLGSVHGTFVNGNQVSGAHPIADGDVIRLGASGPELQFQLSDEGPLAVPSLAATHVDMPVPRINSAELTKVLEDAEAARAAHEAAKAERRKLLIRRVVLVAAGLVLATAATIGWRMYTTRQAEAAALKFNLDRADSLMATVQGVAVSAPAMRGALDSARADAGRLRKTLQQVGRDPDAAAPVLTGLDSAIARAEEVAAAGRFDPVAIAAPSQAAVGLVVAQFADGSSTQTTGFAVRRDGTGGVLLTTKAALVNAAGEQAVSVIVVFPGAAQPLPARILALHTKEDVALLRLQQKGGVPIVPALGYKEPPVGQGEPVSVVGYPPPVDLPPNGDWKKSTLRPVAVTGTAVKVSKGFLMIDGWGSVLSPGTPVIAPDGSVAGMISSAAPSAGGRQYDAVPVQFALELLDQLQ